MTFKEFIKKLEEGTGFLLDCQDLVGVHGASIRSGEVRLLRKLYSGGFIYCFYALDFPDMVKVARELIGDGTYVF